MSLSILLKEEFILVNAQITNKESLLKTIAKTVKKNPILSRISETEIYDKFVEREKLGSTGFGNKIALPHITLDGITDFVVGIITIPEGLDFDSIDKKKAYLFLFIIAPTEKRSMHIRYLSAVSSVFRDVATVDELVASKSPFILKENFLRHTSIKGLTTGKKEYNMLQIFIQKEDKFEDIINILSEIDNANISVIEANNAGRYLNALPLFSSFWNDDNKGFQRMIIVTVEKSLSNNVIRKINIIIDSLKDKSGIMLLMQNISYLNGSLDI